jgi:hypothetical protein
VDLLIKLWKYLSGRVVFKRKLKEKNKAEIENRK